MYNVVKHIRPGQTMTYAEIAQAIGKPRAYRAVGNALNKNRDSNLPCHRVIKSSGELGGFNKGSIQKFRLLISEGVNLKFKMQKSK